MRADAKGIALALLFALLAYGLGRCDGVKQGAREAKIETVLVERERIDTLYRTDTLRLTQWKTRWDSIRVTDTITVDSVVYVPRWIADTTIKACTSALRDCDKLRILNDSLYRLARAASRPSGFWSRVGVSLSYGPTLLPAGKVVLAPQLGASVRIWPP